MNRHPHHHNNYNQNHNNTDPNDKYNIVLQLQNYMFSKTFFETHFIGVNVDTKTVKQKDKQKDRDKNNSEKRKTKEKEKDKEKQKDTKIVNNFFYPSQKDSLFWCFYIIKNGFTPYEIEPANFVKEKTEKIKYIDMIRQDKKVLKEHKIKPVSEIEDYLANKDKIDLKTFIALCILEKINIIIINKKTIFEIVMNETNVVHIIHQQDYFRFNLELNVTEEGLTNYRNNYFKIHQIDKPLLSVSSYKLSELTEFCNKLLITQESFDQLKQKRTKQNTYDLIVSTLNKID